MDFLMINFISILFFLRSELVNLLEDLPLMLSELATTLTPLAKGLEYYRVR